MLGMIHHLLVTERAPLESILDLAADLTNDGVIIEYIGPEDPMFCSLLRGRDDLYREGSSGVAGDHPRRAAHDACCALG